MPKRYKISIKVISQSGTCNRNHKLGDEWIVSETTPEGICLTAFNDLFPHIWALMFGGSYPWESDPDRVTNMACADADNPVVFELKRLHEQ
jgi:uncharacterized repeat protein (TIGR04076 family)